MGFFHASYKGGDTMLKANFTAVPNEVIEDLYRSGLTGTELRIMLFIIRQTAGFHRKSIQISSSAIAKECRLSVSSVDRAAAKLARLGYITVSSDSSHSARTVSFEGTSPVSPDSTVHSAVTDTPFKRNTKENTKESTAPPSEKKDDTRELISEYGAENVRRYTDKVKKWAKRRNIRLADTSATVRKWLVQDGVKRDTFDVSKYEFVINNF